MRFRWQSTRQCPRSSMSADMCSARGTDSGLDVAKMVAASAKRTPGVTSQGCRARIAWQVAGSWPTSTVVTSYGLFAHRNYLVKRLQRLRT